MIRAKLKDKKRVVVKIGSSSLQHSETGDLDYTKMDILVRELCNIRNQGKDVILVTSGAIGCGRKSLQIKPPLTIAQKQACAAIGQARLMTTYQRIFSEYSHQAAQILLTRNTIEADLNRRNAQNTFNELLAMEVIPVVNENDTISTFEVEDVIGDNDTLSAVVTALTGADLQPMKAEARFFLAEDRMSAYACLLRPENGGEEITLEEFLGDMHYEGIHYGILREDRSVLGGNEKR